MPVPIDAECEPGLPHRESTRNAIRSGRFSCHAAPVRSKRQVSTSFIARDEDGATLSAFGSTDPLCITTKHPGREGAVHTWPRPLKNAFERSATKDRLAVQDPGAASFRPSPLLVPLLLDSLLRLSSSTASSIGGREEAMPGRAAFRPSADVRTALLNQIR
jgi:hypothetical protein